MGTFTNFSKLALDDKEINVRGAVLTAEHGAGSVGTGLTPKTYRWTENSHIITEIHVDLTGLKCKGDAAGDAIALTGDGYIGRYVVATCGIVYQVEMICLETPTESTATYTLDINLGAENDSDVAYDGPVDDVILNTGGIALGGVYVNTVPALTADDYIYIVEGDTTAITGVYGAGMMIVRLYGHAVLA